MDPVKEPEGDDSITLYRGVSKSIKPSVLYDYAASGYAVPKGLVPDSPYPGGHENPDDHTMGDNYSIWTSWTTDKATAESFAKGPMGTDDGVVLQKNFSKSRFGKDIIQSDLSNVMQEGEWLVPGIQRTNNVKFIFGKR